jgi:hypothetical protein
VVIPAAAPLVPGRAGEPVRVLFIAGLGRSGSTLLDRVLGQVPGCCSIGEASQVWKGLLAGTPCGCGRRPQECEFWSAVVEAGFGGWQRLDVPAALALQQRVDRTRYLPRLLAPRAAGRFGRDLAAYAALLGRLYAAVAAVAEARVVIDSGKHTSTAYLLRHVPGIAPRIVHLVRDSRGVAYSWTKAVKKSDLAGAPEMDRLPPGRSARGWLVHNLLLQLLPLTGRATHRLRYEDFVAAPEPRVAGLLRFAGLPADGHRGLFSDARTVDLGRPDHTLAGNPVRFRRGPVPIRADEDWRHRLPTRDRALVGLLTAPLLLAYGYRLRAGRGPAIN